LDFHAAFERELKRVSWMIDHGHFEEASACLDDLRKSSKGEDKLSQRCEELATMLEGAGLKSERDAARALGRVLPEFFKKGGDAATTAELLRLAEKFKGTQAAARAEHLAKLPRS
jgi:hypothetical protein